jgi:integrase
MPVISLTDLTIRHLKPEAGKQVTYLDKTLKGFGVRVGASTMTYVLIYGPNRARMKLGEVGILKLAEARQKARTILAERQLGQHRPKGHFTYQDALQGFLAAASVKNRPRTVKDYTRLLTSYGFGQERLGDITPRDVTKKLSGLGPGEKSHAHAALKIFFADCVRKSLLDQSPMLRVERLPRSEPRSRVLTDDELATVWRAGQGMFGDIIKLCVLLGQRRSEIANLRVEYIHDGLITLPATLTKNKHEHTFPYGPMTATILDTLPKTGYLFPARKTWRGTGTVYCAWNKDKPKLDRASGVTGWVIHDLRRTFVSSWAALGIRLEVTEKYVNHISGSQGGIVGIYQRHTFLPEMKDAVARWETHLYSLTDNVRVTPS